MATLTLNKKSNNFEMIAFSDAFAKFDTLLEEGQTVIVQGMIQKRDNETQFYVYDVYDLNSSISRIIQKINFILTPKKESKNFIQHLRKLADEQSGNTRIGIDFLIKNNLVESKTAQSLAINLNLETYNQLIKDPALLGTRAETLLVKDYDLNRRWRKN